MSAPHRIVIAGGGTAGWIAACLMAHHWRDKPVSITLVESADIATVGVGEGSTPTLKRFFSDLNIAESDWMPACNATYKVNIRFKGWSPQNGPDSYSHPFISQPDAFTERPFHVNCHNRRLGLDVNVTPEQFLLNGWLSGAGKAPVTPPSFPFRIEYGYHFDSALLGRYLKRHAVCLGVNHIEGKIDDVITSLSGHITSLKLQSGEMVEGDFFIDCTGFRSLLLQQTLDIRFNPFGENLFNDRAAVLATPAQAQLPVETTSTALSNGWAWSIPLRSRTGNGYVFSSAHLTDDKAEAELRRHLSVQDNEGDVRFLSMRVGQVEKHWHKNCLALGLAQGFIEPLEATALHLVQLSVEFFIEDYEQGNFSPALQDKFNKDVTERFSGVRDYIVAHYKLNTRDDSAYWRENRNNMALSESLLQLLDVWYRKGDFPAEIQRQNIQSHFGITSWHCLLAGYGIFPPLTKQQPGRGDLYKDNDTEAFFKGCLLNFPDHSAYLKDIARRSPAHPLV